MEPTPEGARVRREKLKPSWLEADGRIYSPSAITLRFLAYSAGIAAMELGRAEGAAFGMAITAYLLLYLVATAQRMVAVMQGRKSPDDPRPLRIVPGWLEMDGSLLGATQMMARLVAAACLVAGTLYVDRRAPIVAILVALVGVELVARFLFRVVDGLIQIEVRRRVAAARGEPVSNAWGNRGDHRQE